MLEPTMVTRMSGAWPPRSADGLHGATFEWVGPNTAVRCVCSFHRVAPTHDVAEREYLNHVGHPAIGSYLELSGEQAGEVR